MKSLVSCLTLGLFLLAAKADTPPNFLLIMADDLGFSDLGCYGGEIETPNLDQLAANGLRFTQFYNTARCWPTRAALLTGFYAQQVRRDLLPGMEKLTGNRGKRQPWARLMPDLLKPKGYRSYHSGKWHIDGMPIEMGFDRSYYLKDQGRFFSPKIHWKDDAKLDVVERGTGFYGTTAIADHAIEVLEEHQLKHAAAPFFHYLAFTAPHFPLHALPEDIAKYEGRYDAGWEMIRKERYERQREMGLHKVAMSKTERDLGPPYNFPDAYEILGDGEVNKPLPWDSLTAEQKKFQAKKMELHAAMIDRMDQEIGRVLKQLDRMGSLQNTVVMFLSDNGASAEIMVRTDGHDPSAEPGSAASYLCLGPGWSTACNTPFRRHKTWVHEGGCSTPLIAHWPMGIAEKGAFRGTQGHVVDVAETFMDLAGVVRPASWNGHKSPEAPGKSLVPAFQKDVQIKHDFIWWYHDRHKAVRQGDWKLVAPEGQPWELYNLKNDRAEQNDLSEKRARKAKALEKLWNDKLAEFKGLALDSF